MSFTPPTDRITLYFDDPQPSSTWYNTQATNPLYFTAVAGTNNMIYTSNLSGTDLATLNNYALAGSSCNYSQLVIPNCVTSLGIVCFGFALNLTKVTFLTGSTITSLPYGTFSQCTALQTITLPPLLTLIGNEAFKACYSLASIDLGSLTNLTNIDVSAFELCIVLNNIVIPYNNGTTVYLGNSCFKKCVGLTNLTVYSNADLITTTPFTSSPFYFTNVKYLFTNVISNTSEICTYFDTNFPSVYILDDDKVNLFFNTTAPTTTGYSVSPLNANQLIQTGTSTTLQAFGSSTTNNTLIFAYIPSNITTISSSCFINCKALTQILFNSSSTLTSLGTSFCSGCSALTTINIPNTVTTISDNAFKNCLSIASISLPTATSFVSIGQSSFSGCVKLSSITYGTNITTIGSSAFFNCSSLTTLPALNSVTSIGNTAFSGCTNLSSLYMSVSGNVTFGTTTGTPVTTSVFSNVNNLTIYTNNYNNSVYTFIKTYYSTSNITVICSNNIVLQFSTAPATLTYGSITYDALNNGKVLTSTTTPTSITSNSFQNVTTLTNVLNIPAAVTSIGASAFQGCTGLTSIIIPDTITSLGNNAFNGCISLTTCTMNSNVTTIGTNVFTGNTSFTTLNTNTYNTAYQYIALNNPSVNINVTNSIVLYFSQSQSPTVVFDGNTYTSLNGGTLFISSPGITTISDYAFAAENPPHSGTFTNFQYLTKVILPATLTYIGDYAFFKCPLTTATLDPNMLINTLNPSVFQMCTFTQFTIPNNVQYIGKNALAATGLTSLTIPSSVLQCEDFENIGPFQGNASLQTVTILNGPNGEGCTMFGVSSFANCTSLRYINPSSTYDVNIPNSVKVLGNDCFSNCRGLTSVKLSDFMVSPGQFLGAYMSTITFPLNCNEIPSGFAIGCPNLTTISLPGGIQFIGTQAFKDCSSLTTANIGNCTSIPADMFSGTPIVNVNFIS